MEDLRRISFADLPGLIEGAHEVGVCVSESVCVCINVCLLTTYFKSQEPTYQL